VNRDNAWPGKVKDWCEQEVHMKKVFLLAVLAVFAVIAIGGLWAGGQAEAADDGSLSVGYSPKFLKDDFQVLLLGAVENGLDERGWKLAGAPDANGDVAKQVSDLENLLAAGADALVIVPVDGAGVVPAIRRANEAGIPVFSIDDGPSGGQVAATVRADNVDAGVQGAKEMIRRLQQRDSWPNSTVLELQGGLATPNGMDRSTGFYDTMRELAPSVRVIQRPTEWTADMAADATQNVLTQVPDLDGIFMASELMASAVNARLAEAGRNAPVGDPRSVVRVAIDGTPAGLELIRNGALDATVSQPLSGYASKTLELIQLSIDGGSAQVGEYDDGRVIMTDVGPQYQLYATLVTAENVDDPTLWGNL
jgi:ribose transport system substrate-binding protein